MNPIENSLLFIFIAGVVANGIWRFAGLVLSSGLPEDSAAIAWVKAVSTALVSGLVARIVLFPPGALADYGAAVRLGAFFAGMAVYFAARRHMGLGMLAAVLSLIGAQLLTR